MKSLKSGKRLNKKQKVLVQENGLNPSEWLVTKNLSDKLYLVHRETGKEKSVDNY
ncbi:DUF6906 family protein [Anaerobacillus sp. MEB173]|uniref:DUF6906 family protein n=1 Tax=Anaerobacillus sp. MEB173 TaxID=3383345 RepID=UPI003F92360A